MEPLLTVQQVAKLLGRTTRTLYRWRKAGIGPKWIAFGGQIRFKQSDVNRFLEGK